MRTIKGISARLLAACSSIASAEGWQLHGFGDISVRNDYVTPRGLVVTTSGAAVQVLNGLVAVSPGGVAFHGGTWVDLNPGYSKADGNITAVNEFDFFFGVSANVTPKLHVRVAYSQLLSGQPSVASRHTHTHQFPPKYSEN